MFWVIVPVCVALQCLNTSRCLEGHLGTHLGWTNSAQVTWSQLSFKHWRVKTPAGPSWSHDHTHTPASETLKNHLEIEPAHYRTGQSLPPAPDLRESTFCRESSGATAEDSPSRENQDSGPSHGCLKQAVPSPPRITTQAPFSPGSASSASLTHTWN